MVILKRSGSIARSVFTSFSSSITVREGKGDKEDKGEIFARSQALRVTRSPFAKNLHSQSRVCCREAQRTEHLEQCAIALSQILQI
jgi:hypothetical protein